MAMTSLTKALARRARATVASASALIAVLAIAAPVDAQQPQRKSGQSAAPASIEPSAQGIWIDHTGRGAVEIVPCMPVAQGASGAAPPSAQKPTAAPNLCGRIVWLQNPNDEKGQPLIDDLNKNVAKRGAPICGLQIIGGVKPQPDGSWDNGWIYDPEKGSAFDLELRMRSPDTLQVKGYLGVKLLSETHLWRRAKQVPPRCPGA